MGLFDTDDIDDELKRLAEKAESGTVSPRRLTNLHGGLELKEHSLIEYFDREEQPHYLFDSLSLLGSSVDIELGDVTAKLIEAKKAVTCITDRRILSVGSESDMDVLVSVAYDEIYGVEWDGLSMVNPMGRRGHTITFDVKSDAMFASAFGAGKGDAVRQFVGLGDDMKLKIRLKNLHMNSTVEPGVEYIRYKSATGPEAMYQSRMAGYTDEEERLGTVLKGKLADMKVDGVRQRQYGGRGVYTALTDRRVILAIETRTSGEVVESIEYPSLSSVDLDQSGLFDYLNVHTADLTYSMNVFDANKAGSAVTEIRQYVDEHRTSSEVQDPDDGQDDTGETGSNDPAERLRLLKQLLDEEVITQEEFEEKKESVIDEL